MTIDLASYNEGVRAGRRDGQIHCARCPECNGTGQVLNADKTEIAMCPVCSGSGSVEGNPLNAPVSRDELLELARQWAAEAERMRVDATMNPTVPADWLLLGQSSAFKAAADQLTRLLRAEDPG